MPRYGRRRTYRRSYRRRKPAFRRRTFRRRTVRRPRYLFKRKVQFSLISLVPAVTARNGFMYFRLNDIPQYTDITNLFDQYKINKVKVEFIPTVNSFDDSTDEIPQVLVAIDKNTAAPLSGVDTVMAYQNCQQFSADKYYSRSFKPNYLIADSLGSNYQTAQTFQSTSLYDIHHYGLQWAVPIFANTTNVDIQVWVTYWIECRTPR